MAYSDGFLNATNMSSEPPLSISARIRLAFEDTVSARSRKQLLLFAAGSTFLFFSMSITRRALVKRSVATFPKFYHPGHLPIPGAASFNGPTEALQALNLATLNTMAASMTLVGGVLWAFDISTLDEMRQKVRGGLGVDGTGRTESDVEEEFEEWIAGVLKRKDDKEKNRAEAREKVQREWTNSRGKQR